jgi:hypothetical protein
LPLGKSKKIRRNGLNGTCQLKNYADGVNLLGGNTNTTKKIEKLY